MRYRLTALLAVIVAFGVLSARALTNVGYLGIITFHFQNWGGVQVLADLVILAVLACRWMARDAHARGIAAWPFIAVTVVAGSFGPLFYLVARELGVTSKGGAVILPGSVTTT